MKHNCNLINALLYLGEADVHDLNLSCFFFSFFFWGHEFIMLHDSKLVILVSARFFLDKYLFVLSIA